MNALSYKYFNGQHFVCFVVLVFFSSTQKGESRNTNHLIFFLQISYFLKIPYCFVLVFVINVLCFLVGFLYTHTQTQKLSNATEKHFFSGIVLAKEAENTLVFLFSV